MVACYTNEFVNCTPDSFCTSNIDLSFYLAVGDRHIHFTNEQFAFSGSYDRPLLISKDLDAKSATR